MATHKHTHTRPGTHTFDFENPWNCHRSSRTYAYNYVHHSQIWQKFAVVIIIGVLLCIKLQHSFVLFVQCVCVHHAHAGKLAYPIRSPLNTASALRAVRAKREKKCAKENPVIRACSPTILLFWNYFPPRLALSVYASVRASLSCPRPIVVFMCSAMYYLPLNVLFP